VPPAAPWRALRVSAHAGFFSPGLKPLTRAPRTHADLVHQTFSCNLFLEASWVDKALLLENGKARGARGTQRHTRRSRTQLSPPLRRASGEGGGPGADPAGATRCLRARQPHTS
jgi:hypothetical protein